VITAENEISVEHVGKLSKLTSKYDSIIAIGNIDSGSNLKANRSITTKNIADNCNIKADNDINCGTVGALSSVVSKYGSIKAKTIFDQCLLLQANRSIDTENIGFGCTIKADNDINCGSVGNRSSITSKYGSIESFDISDNCKLTANRHITSQNISENCKLNADNDINCQSVGKSSSLKSEYGNITVKGHIASQTKLNASRTIKYASAARNAELKADPIVKLNTKTTQRSSSQDSQHEKISGKVFEVEGDLNGTVLVKRTPNSASITINSKGTTYIKKGIVTSGGSELTEQKHAKTTKAPSKKEFRNRFLASFNKRQKAKTSQNPTHKKPGNHK